MEFSLKSSGKKQRASSRPPAPDIFGAEEDEFSHSHSFGDAEKCSEAAVNMAEQGNFEEAARLFKQSLKLVPNDSKVLEMLAQVYLELDEVVMALQSAEMAIRAHTTPWKEGLLTLARCQREFGEVQLSSETYSLLLALDPEDSDIVLESKEVDSLVRELNVKKAEQLHRVTESETHREAQQCIYHLCHRAHAVNSPAVSSGAVPNSRSGSSVAGGPQTPNVGDLNVSTG